MSFARNLLIGLFIAALLQVTAGAAEITLPASTTGPYGLVSMAVQKHPTYQKSLPHTAGCVQVPSRCKCVVRESGGSCLRAGNCYQ